MTGQDRVCVVVVTFNRKDMLRECLQSLKRQTRVPDQFVVVNNHSNDGTDQMLATEFPDLPVIHMPENAGGAGGFHAGMKWAYEHGFEWAWVMDDDVEPLPGALEQMLQYRELSGFIQFRRESPEGLVELEGAWDLSSCQYVPYGYDRSFRGNDREWITVQFGCFEGALIHRGVMAAIGFPDVRYFIWGDDTIYGFEASFHTNVLYVRPVGLVRKFSAMAKRSKNMYYFSMRNRFLTFEHMRRSGIPLNLKLFWFDTLMLLLWGVKDALLHAQPRTICARAVVEGIWDGIQGRFGRPAWIR